MAASSSSTESQVRTSLRGKELVTSSVRNKDLAFTDSERIELHLEGLFPPAVRSLPHQSRIVLENLARCESPIHKYIFLRHLLSANSVLFYYTLVHNIELIMPLVYTPTVGEACVKYSDLIFPPLGLYLPATARGRFIDLMRNATRTKDAVSGKQRESDIADIRVIVVTDGERILGLGDLAANGMGIPVGKLSLYSACAGIHPAQTLPITLDMGTNTKSLIDNPNYIGLRQPRLKGAEFDVLLEEFVSAATHLWPHVLIQWEDFGNTNAFRLLEKYRASVCSFNDDIQGTACVALAGLIAAVRINKKPLNSQRFLFLGAGEAGVGIGDLISYFLVKTKAFATIEEARKNIFFVDSQGLVCKSRINSSFASHKIPYAHDVPFLPTLAEAVSAIRPSAIIGVSTQPHTFTKAIIEEMSRINEHPIIFALSNPTSKAECTAEEAYTWSDGKAIYASGSPFDPVTYKGRTYVPGQGNNSYVFPGIGLGVIASEAATVSEDMFVAAASALAEMVSEDDLAQGLIYPPLKTIRTVSLHIAQAVADLAFQTGVARAKLQTNVKDLILSYFYEPGYDQLIASL